MLEAVALFCSLLLSGPDAGPAIPAVPAHPGPPVYVQIDVEERTVLVTFRGEQNTILPWLGQPVPENAEETLSQAEIDAFPALTPEEERALEKGVQDFFGQGQIRIDGVARPFVVEELGIPRDVVQEYGLPALTFTLRFELEDAPRRVGVSWDQWERMEWFDKIRLPLLFRSFGKAKLGFVGPDEPEFIWHAASIVPTRPPVEVKAPPPATWNAPLWSVGIALVGLGAALGLRRQRRWVPVGVSLAALATAFLMRDVRAEVPNPLIPDVEVPPDADAVAVFDTLHQNVYDAFFGDSEDEIYDLLAVSVTPDLLDEIYGEVMESLIMRSEEGAICQVEKVDRQEREVLGSELEPWDVIDDAFAEAPRFKVRCTWQVHGVVSHWGHEHRRVNDYDAEYIVLHDGDAWRIGSVQINDHSYQDRDG